MMSKVCLVTGGTSGIGKAVCEYLLRQGCSVYEFSRREKGIENVKHFSVDITDTAAVQLAVDAVLSDAGKIDVLINNAGFGISGAIEFSPMKEIHRQFDVNFFGMVAVTKAVLPYMRKQKSGRVINVSSVAAPVPIPFQAFYSASKAAINDFTLALANEVRPYGIQTCIVQPGDIATGFTDARSKTNAGNEEYAGRIEHSVSVMEKDERSGMDPASAGEAIGKLALRKHCKSVYTIGFSYRLICFIVKLLPTGLMNTLVGKIYAK